MNEKILINSYLEKQNYTQKRASTTSFPSPLTDKADEEDEKKMEQIEQHFRSILEIIGLDLTHESLAKTPKRVTKMWIEELLQGIKKENFPKLTFISLDNPHQQSPIYTYDISVQSMCEHHFLPMTGVAHIGYIPNQKMIGLSKLNRIVDYFAKRAQLQERLTLQIADCLSYVLDTSHIALYISLRHSCVQLRGPKDTSLTVTSTYLGQFKEDPLLRQEFLSKISR